MEIEEGKIKKKKGKQGNANRKLPQNDLTGHARKACAKSKRGGEREAKGGEGREGK